MSKHARKSSEESRYPRSSFVSTKSEGFFNTTDPAEHGVRLHVRVGGESTELDCTYGKGVGRGKGRVGARYGVRLHVRVKYRNSSELVLTCFSFLLTWL